MRNLNSLICIFAEKPVKISLSVRKSTALENCVSAHREKDDLPKLNKKELADAANRFHNLEKQRDKFLKRAKVPGPIAPHTQAIKI